LHEQEASTAAFSRLKALNSSLPILNKILKTSITLILVLAFLPIYEVPILLCMCVALGPFVQYAGFSTAEESNAFIDVILLQDKRTIDRFRFADTPWV
jgi:hypothetical protein